MKYVIYRDGDYLFEGECFSRALRALIGYILDEDTVSYELTQEENEKVTSLLLYNGKVTEN